MHLRSKANKFFSHRTRNIHRSGPVFWGWYVVFSSFVMLTLIYGARYSFGVFVKPMFAEYNWPMTVISLAASINLLMAAGMFLLCRATNVIMLYAFAMFFGFGYGSLAPVTPYLISDRFGRQVLGVPYGLPFFLRGLAALWALFWADSFSIKPALTGRAGS